MYVRNEGLMGKDMLCTYVCTELNYMHTYTVHAYLYSNLYSLVISGILGIHTYVCCTKSSAGRAMWHSVLWCIRANT